MEEAARKKRKPAGERREDILQALCGLLEDPACARATTRLLAGRLGLSEAALYRQFASKAQMYEQLLGYVESSLLGLFNHIRGTQPDPLSRVEAQVYALLGFADANHGLLRILAGDALACENPRLGKAVHALIGKLESQLGQGLSEAVACGVLAQGTDVRLLASLLMSYVQGRWLRCAQSGFAQQASAQGQQALALLFGA